VLNNIIQPGWKFPTVPSKRQNIQLLSGAENSINRSKIEEETNIDNLRQLRRNYREDRQQVGPYFNLC
jgi:hypothetical protein